MSLLIAWCIWSGVLLCLRLFLPLLHHDNIKLCKGEIKLQDLWIGAYWDRKKQILLTTSRVVPRSDKLCAPKEQWRLDIWLIAVPCFPLHIRIEFPLEEANA